MYIAIAGNIGAGKTTLTKMLAGDVLPQGTFQRPACRFAITTHNCTRPQYF